VRISELVERSGIPLSAVKYYQREGLLPEGERTAPNQVDYGEEHVQRLRLVRALLDTGGLSIAATKDVIAALSSPETPIAETFRIAQHAMGSPRAADSAPSAASIERIASSVRDRGWHVSDDNPGIATAARALDGLLAIGFDPPDDYVAAYTRAAAAAAAADLEALGTLHEPERVTELMIVGSVLGDPLFAGLRRLAHEDATVAHYPTDTERKKP
jgi:DNA-binding transcriptional MerR regulator